VNARALGARGDGKTDDTVALQQAVDQNQTIYLPMGRYLVTDTLRLRPDSVLIGLHPSATQLVLPDGTPAFQGAGGPKALLEAPRGGSTIVIGVGLYTNGVNPRAVGAKWMAGARSMMNDVRFLGGHGTTGLDGRRENPYNNNHSADPRRERAWDSQYPSLWVTEGGGGTFFDIWTPSTFAQAGLLVSHTNTSGRVYQMSSEHHVRHEVQLRDVSHWEFHALQTEAERGESGHALQLEIRNARNILITNLHIYRVISSDQPYRWAVKVADSEDIRFRNVHSYSNSKVAYDTTVFDEGTNLGVRAREFAWLDVSGGGRPAEPGVSRILDGPVQRLAEGFHHISGGAVDGAGDFHFVDARWQRIHRWSSAKSRLFTVADGPMAPVNLAFDADGNMLVVSSSGPGTVYVQRSDLAIELLPPLPAAARPGMIAILPVGDWRLPQPGPARTHHFLAPDGRTYLSATSGFVRGETSWGVKSSDLIRAFGLQKAQVGQRVYLTSEADVSTWSGVLEENGNLTDVRLFVHQGGEGVAVDSEGNVYIANGEVFVYDPLGRLIDTLQVPERPTQLVFGGPDGRTLFLPARNALYAARVRFKGR
jgi:sugar lactone lactonase YvrE